MSGHELVRTRLCGQPDCGDEVARPGVRGLYGGYCDTHARVRQVRNQKRATEAAAADRDGLLAVGRTHRRMERLRGQAEKKLAEYKAAREEYLAALDAAGLMERRNGDGG